jgi:hypothetical protein
LTTFQLQGKSRQISKDTVSLYNELSFDTNV